MPDRQSSHAAPGGLTFRENVQPGDVEAVRTLVESTGFFYPEEVLIAAELVTELLEKGPESGYRFILAESALPEVVGYTCYGPVPGTSGSFDLYWIAVGQTFRGRGIGRLLLERTERAAAASGARKLYVETSSRELYEPTRRFYLSSGYRREAFLEDFYAPGDGKLIYVKDLS